jgi:hypothetical protein
VGSGQDLTPTRLPSKLPPLDVSPPSLDFSTSLSPFSRNQAILGGGRLTSAGINPRGRGSPVKTHPNRPLITLTIPPGNAFNEADGEVFVSPRSAPTPPQLTAPPDDGSPASFLSTSAPGSPLRFPIPPPQEDITTPSPFADDTPLRRDRSSEFNAHFSFPRKEDGAIRNTGRNTSFDLSTMRPLERKMNLRKAHSTASKSQVSLYNCPGLELLPENRGIKAPQPPPIPLPAPPSTFSTDTDDPVGGELPITTSTSSLLFTQTRSRQKTVSSPSTSPQKDDSKEDERFVLQTQARKRGERRNAWTTDQRDQTVLRVETNAQRTRLEELEMRFQEFVEASERERRGLTARLADVERLVEEQQGVIKCLQSLVPVRDTGRIDWGHGELSPTTMQDLADLLGSLYLVFPCLGIATGMRRTPALESPMFSPAITFENGSCPLKRSNTLADGYIDRVRRQGELNNDRQRNNEDWSQFINGTGLRRMDRRDGELPDSPVVREGSEATLVSSPSSSDLLPRMTHEARSSDGDQDARMLGNREPVSDYERMKQWTPNMQEILAKLRTFESGSPTER